MARRPVLFDPDDDGDTAVAEAVRAQLEPIGGRRSNRSPIVPAETEAEAAARDALAELTADLAAFEFDPLGFVLYAFPWGEPGKGLDDELGPEQWQIDELERIGAKLEAGGDLGAVVEEDTTAGHGVGKSALVSWLILWAISTHAHTRGVVTANTEGQLRTKTWAELGKWHALFIAKDLFTYTATAIYSADRKHARTWRIDAVPWNAAQSAAFAGLHNKGRRIIVIFDEASEIDDVIWQVTEGALTDEATQIVWARFGNPTRTSGEFHKRVTNALTNSKARNHATRVDGRSVRFTNKALIQQWADEYGEDSDFFRIRVKGEFPRAGVANFIGYELAQAARKREVPRLDYQTHPVILSCDPARFGDDWTIITVRQGLRVHLQAGMLGFAGPEVAERIKGLCVEHKPICIAYDAIGVGADLDSSLRRIPNLPRLVPVQWGIPATDVKAFFNQRAEAWSAMRDWLANGEIPDDDELGEQLTGLQYGYDHAYRIQLETKKAMKARGLKSPDKADSLALSFIPDLLSAIAKPAAKVRTVQRRQVVWARRT